MSNKKPRVLDGAGPAGAGAGVGAARCTVALDPATVQEAFASAARDSAAAMDRAAEALRRGQWSPVAEVRAWKDGKWVTFAAPVIEAPFLQAVHDLVGKEQVCGEACSVACSVVWCSLLLGSMVWCVVW